MKSMQDAPGCYTEILAMICARRAPNLAFLSTGATISGLTSTILEQIKTGQPSLERHAYAWTEIPQSFMDIAGEGKYYETHCIDDADSKGDTMSLYVDSSASEGSQKSGK